MNSKLKGYVINNIKKFKQSNNTRSPSTKEIKEIDKLCKECNQPAKENNIVKIAWCQPCNSQHFQQDFKNWTSGNPEINEFIQKYQLEANSPEKILEWIPYDKFTDIEYFAEGGFGKVLKARWVDGQI